MYDYWMVEPQFVHLKIEFIITINNTRWISFDAIQKMEDNSQLVKSSLIHQEVYATRIYNNILYTVCAGRNPMLGSVYPQILMFEIVQAAQSSPAKLIKEIVFPYSLEYINDIAVDKNGNMYLLVQPYSKYSYIRILNPEGDVIQHVNNLQNGLTLDKDRHPVHSQDPYKSIEGISYNDPSKNLELSKTVHELYRYDGFYKENVIQSIEIYKDMIYVNHTVPEFSIMAYQLLDFAFVTKYLSTNDKIYAYSL